MVLAPIESKTMWLAFYYTAITVGYAFGFIWGSMLAEALHGWYWPFVIEGLILLPLALVLFSQRGDERIHTAKGDVPMIGQIGQLLTNKLYMSYVLGYSAYLFTIGGCAVWINYFLIKHFGLEPFRATMVAGLLTVTTGLIGTFVGSLV
jgi:MFS family permease